jgi:prephenate dehydrogenase
MPGTSSVGIIGLGLMGGSLALALKRGRPELTLLGSDRDPLVCRKAMERGMVEIAAPDLEAVAAAGVVVLAVPVLALRDLLPRLRGHRGVVTDTASTKVRVLEWAAGAGVDLVGGHPMCGSEASGLQAADADLYRDAPWVLTRSEPAVVELVEAAGARPVVMEAERHDRLVAEVSHAAFVLSTAYLLAAAQSPDWPEMAALAAGGFRDMTRLAGGEPEMYTGIALTNGKHIAEAVRGVEAMTARVIRHIERGDHRLAELFEEARAVRRRWEAERAAGPR